MNQLSSLFIDALRCALHDDIVSWTDAPEWGALFRLADSQHVSPMIFQAVRRCPCAEGFDWSPIRNRVMQLIMLQARRSAAFSAVYSGLRAAGLRPLMVKGLVCRALYPHPDQRISGDEDILIPPEQFEPCAKALLDMGFRLAKEGQRLEDYEVSFFRPADGQYLELHRSLFAPESDAVGDLNALFPRAHADAVSVTVDGVEYLTLSPTDHMLFLILHAFKHFLHCGFGLRQAADICLFGAAYPIDWDSVLPRLEAANARTFAAAVFAIGRNHLGLDAPLPPALQSAPDELPMIRDMLQGGVYGTSSFTRAHSSNITLHAVASQKAPTAQKSGLLRSLFPPKKAMLGAFPWLERFGFLLPIAWAIRIFRYGRRNRVGDARASLDLGRQRIELLRHYGIIHRD